MFDGDTAFTLYDTYGFPSISRRSAALARYFRRPCLLSRMPWSAKRAKARASWAGSGEAAQETVWFALRDKVGATEFLGYETESAEGVVAALVKDGKEVPELKKGESGAVVMNQTPFYGESGGQVGDTGEMRREGVRLIVSDTQKEGGRFVHSRREGGAGIDQSWRSACCWTSITRAAAQFVRIIRRHTFFTRRCARCSAITSRRKVRSWHPTGCGSISHIQNRCRRRKWSELKTSPTTSFSKMHQ
jgi:alanyl-tRNA synthetase